MDTMRYYVKMGWMSDGMLRQMVDGVFFQRDEHGLYLPVSNWQLGKPQYICNHPELLRFVSVKMEWEEVAGDVTITHKTTFRACTYEAAIHWREVFREGKMHLADVPRHVLNCEEEVTPA